MRTPISPGLSRAPVTPGSPRRWALRRRRAYREAQAAAVLRLLDALVPALKAGLPPLAALRTVTMLSDTDDVAATLIEAADTGLPLGPVWLGTANRLGSADLRLAGSAWSLCDAMGSPLAPTLATVVTTVRQRRELQRRIDAALAGPQATVRVLSVLPALGPVVAVLVGVPVEQLYAGSAGLVALASGAALLLLGRWWCRRLVRSVAGDGRSARRREADLV
jgi:tight adherence protein B